MPLLIDTDSRTDVLTRAINHLLVLDGVTGLSLRRIARASGVHPSSMLHHYGSREQLLRVAAARTARARLTDIRLRTRAEGVLAFLPSSLEGVPDVRAWLAWHEVWRSEPGLENTLQAALADERSWLCRMSGFACTNTDLEHVTVLVDGLMLGLTRPVNPLRLTTAREILEREVRRAGYFPPLAERFLDPRIADIAILAAVARDRRTST